jgi:hypothetical protein
MPTRSVEPVSRRPNSTLRPPIPERVRLAEVKVHSVGPSVSVA